MVVYIVVSIPCSCIPNKDDDKFSCRVFKPRATLHCNWIRICSKLFDPWFISQHCVARIVFTKSVNKNKLSLDPTRFSCVQFDNINQFIWKFVWKKVCHIELFLPKENLVKAFQFCRGTNGLQLRQPLRPPPLHLFESKYNTYHGKIQLLIKGGGRRGNRRCPY